MGTLSKLRRLVLREGVSVREAAQRLGIARNTASRWLALVDVTVLKQAIKVGDSGALALRLKEQRQVEQSYRKETKKQQYHKTYPQSCNKTSTTKWLIFESEVWLCLVSESTFKTLEAPLVPKAPNSVFQLHMAL